MQKVLIGSSPKGMGIASAIQSNLEDKCWPTTLSQTDLSAGVARSLLGILKKSDFGVFVFVPEDFTERFVDNEANFLFGMFYGNLGKDRTFCLVPKEYEYLPYFNEYNAITYNPKRVENYQAGCGPACDCICTEIQKRGYRDDPYYDKLLKLVSSLFRSTSISAVNYNSVLETVSQLFDVVSAPTKVSAVVGSALICGSKNNQVIRLVGASGDIDMQEVISLQDSYLNTLKRLGQERLKYFNSFKLDVIENKILERSGELEYVLIIPVTENTLLTTHFQCTKLSDEYELRNMTTALITNNMRLIKIIRKYIEGCERDAKVS